MKTRMRAFGVLLALGLVAGLAVPAIGEARDGSDPMMTGTNGWTVETLMTVGTDAATFGDYVVPGVLDGLGAWSADDLGLESPKAGKIVRILANHEFNDTRGYAYELDNGTMLTGARVSYLDVDVESRKVVDAGLAYDTVYDRRGDMVTEAAQINEDAADLDGFDRFCSAQDVHAGTYGFVDDIFLANEESGKPYHPHGGTVWALDVEEGELWAVPAMGRGAWENVTPIDLPDSEDTVEIVLGDDSAPAPLYLYVGQKDAVDDGSFLDRNGLAVGDLYAWAGDGVSTPEDFNTAGSVNVGEWVHVEVRNLADAGSPGYDDQGYLDIDTLQQAAAGAGAFLFSRPEDVATDPADDDRVVLASTGRGQLYPSDDWGTLYLIDVADATITILYDGDTTYAPDHGLRSPDNLDWAADGRVYVQEDRSTSLDEFGGASGTEASIWAVSPVSGMLEHVAEMNRDAVPAGQTDGDPDDLGDWESSGVLDVTHLFAVGRHSNDETVLLADVQAHSIGLGNDDLVQGSQLILVSR